MLIGAEQIATLALNPTKVVLPAKFPLGSPRKARVPVDEHVATTRGRGVDRVRIAKCDERVRIFTVRIAARRGARPRHDGILSLAPKSRDWATMPSPRWCQWLMERSKTRRDVPEKKNEPALSEPSV